MYGFKQKIDNLLRNTKDQIPELFSKFNKFYRAELNNYILDKIKEKTENKRIKTLLDTFVNGDSEENRENNIKLFSKIKKWLSLDYHPDKNQDGNQDGTTIIQKINSDFDNRMSGGKKRKSRRKNAPI